MKTIISSISVILFSSMALATTAPTHIKCAFGTNGSGPLSLEVKNGVLITNAGLYQGLIVKVKAYSIPVKSLKQTSTTLKVVADTDKNGAAYDKKTATGQYDRIEVTYGVTNGRYDHLVLKVSHSENNLYSLSCVAK